MGQTGLWSYSLLTSDLTRKSPTICLKYILKNLLVINWALRERIPCTFPPGHTAGYTSLPPSQLVGPCDGALVRRVGRRHVTLPEDPLSSQFPSPFFPPLLAGNPKALRHGGALRWKEICSYKTTGSIAASSSPSTHLIGM